MTDHDIIRHISAVLASDELGDLSEDDARLLAQVGLGWAVERARASDELGRGEDRRALFALSVGFTVGAMAWRKALIDLGLGGS